MMQEIYAFNKKVESFETPFLDAKIIELEAEEDSEGFLTNNESDKLKEYKQIKKALEG